MILHGLRRFRYMTVSVQRGGQFRYMTTSVHMRSISVRVICSTTSVHVKYRFGTSLSRYIASCLFYAEGVQMLNGCLVCYVKLLMCNWMFFFTVDIKHWSPPADHRANQRQQKLNKHVTSDVQVQVYVSETSWKGAACLPHHSAH